MKNPFKNNSLASFLFGIIVGAGACTGFFAVTEPETTTNTQGQVSGFISVPVADNNSQQQLYDGQNDATTPQPEQIVENASIATNDNAEITHTKSPNGKRFHGLTDNPNGDVRITRSGKKYHRPSCGSIQGHDFISVTRSDAENANLSPCKRCKP